MARVLQGIWAAVGGGLRGFPYGVPGGFLLSSTLAAAGACDLWTPMQESKWNTSEGSHSWLVECLALLIGIVLLIGSLPVIGGLLYLTALVAYRRARKLCRAGDAEWYTTEVVVVGLAVLVGIPFINGCFGFILEAALGRSDILVLHKNSVEVAVNVACLLGSPMATAFAAGGMDALVAMQDRFGLGAAELGAAAVTGWGILWAVLKYQSVLGQWATVGAMMGPAVAAGVALSAGIRRGSSTYGRAGRVGAILGAALGGGWAFWSDM
ncbi:hypothetical protein UPYG_G00048690 [Umbra pygmaea]|uniref:Uncharacterized protein n=1 Tax=Umbra pygmaea TaxID=75934 RepID=A0ABD0XTI4_UMBPY